MKNPLNRSATDHTTRLGGSSAKATQSEKAQLLLKLFDTPQNEAWGAEFVAKLKGLVSEEDTTSNLQISKAAADELLELVVSKSRNESSETQRAMKGAEPTLVSPASKAQNAIEQQAKEKAQPRGGRPSVTLSSDKEHPAIIARRIISYPVQERQKYLKSLDGSLARQVSFALSQFGTR